MHGATEVARAVAEVWVKKGLGPGGWARRSPRRGSAEASRAGAETRGRGGRRCPAAAGRGIGGGGGAARRKASASLCPKNKQERLRRSGGGRAEGTGTGRPRDEAPERRNGRRARGRAVRRTRAAHGLAYFAYNSSMLCSRPCC